MDSINTFKAGSAYCPSLAPKNDSQRSHNGVSKEWDAGLLENYVSPEDIPLIRSLAISPTNRWDTFCCNYTKNGQYTVKSGYWVTRNIHKKYEEIEVWNPV